MFEKLSFDELNQLVGTPRSEQYNKYFSVMNISEKEKLKRISLAKKLENKFIESLIFIFTMQQYTKNVNWDLAQEKLKQGYLAALHGTITIDDYIKAYAQQFSENTINATRRNENNPWYYSEDRAIFQSENESNSSWEYQNYTDAIKTGKKRKRWKTIRDGKERETHAAADRKTIGINDVFLVGNSMFRYARDNYFSPESKEVVGCRCTTEYF